MSLLEGATEMKKIDIDHLLESTVDLKANMKDFLIIKLEIDQILDNQSE